MKATCKDIETGTVHEVHEISFSEGMVSLYSEEYGYTSQEIDKIVWIDLPSELTAKTEDINLKNTITNAVWEARKVYTEHTNTPYNRLRPIIQQWVSTFLKTEL